jgi:hypothetical protein
MLHAWSADMAGLSRMRGQRRAGTGSASGTVHGSRTRLVDYTRRARVAQTGCEVTAWESKTLVRCLVTPGAQGTRMAVLKAGAWGGSVTQWWSADVAGLSEVQRISTVASGVVLVPVQGTRMEGADGVRGDGVGVGDIGDVQCAAGGAVVEEGSGDCRSCGPRP